MCKLILIFFLSPAAFAQPFVNLRIFPSTLTQTEPVVAVHPTNPLMMFVSAVTIDTSSGFRSEGVYVTTNGGATWFGSDTCKGELLANHGGSPGVAIDPTGRLVLTHIGYVFSGVYSHYSTNLGFTWSSAFTLTSEQTDDKGTTAIDNTPMSPYYGKLYNARAILAPPYPVLVATSTNGAANWSSPSSINNPPPARCSGGFVKTGSDGRVYVCWAGMTGVSPFIEDFVGIAQSSDGGATWRVSQNVYDVNGITGTLAAKNNIRVNGLPHLDIDKSGGARNNWIYVVTTERNLAPAGTDPDVVLHRSTDGGLTWSVGKRVNQDALNNGKIQYFPALHVDAFGGVNIIYYDDRNTSSDSAEVMIARSVDGGDTWIERVISTHRFKPRPILGGSSNYQGDHIALTSSGTKLHAFWMDNSSGLYQIWNCQIELQSLGILPAEPSVPRGFELKQNYPNPFNPTTTIRYSIPPESQAGAWPRQVRVSLQVYDLLGREVAALVDEKKSPGTYEVGWNAEGVSSGIYFYRLIAGGQIATKSMLLLK